MNIKIAKNHWGWTPKKIMTWMNYGWAFPWTTWGVEISKGSLTLETDHNNQIIAAKTEGPRFQRRCKIGPIAFNLGTYS